MSNHVTEWLNAYFDGELTGRRLLQVEDHLAECEACQAELDSLQGLSKLLHEVPAPAVTSVERFAAQVSLRLPRPKAEAPRKRILEVGWWMIPVGLLAIWIVMNASFFAYDVLSVANSFGWLTSVSDWVRFGTSSAAGWSSALGQIGLLRGSSLTLAASTETFTRISLLQVTLQVSIALLYLSWIAIWWTHHQRQPRAHPLES